MNFSSELLDGDELLNGRETESIFQMSRNYFSLIVVVRLIKLRIQNAQIVCFHYFSSWLNKEKKTKIEGSVEQQSFTALSYPSTPTSTVLLIIMCQCRRCEKYTSKQVLTRWALLSDIAKGVYSRKPVSQQLNLPSRSLAPSVVLFLALLFMVEPFLPFRFCVCHLTHFELVEKRSRPSTQITISEKGYQVNFQFLASISTAS